MSQDSPPLLSVVVPAHNNGQDLRRCLAALEEEPEPACEIIVVDDGSTQDLGPIAGGPRVRLLRLADNAGPAAARNHGASQARGEILLFVDADVVVARGTLRRVAEILAARPDVAAVFGSYDARPSAPAVVSQYRNLLHHYVHQTGGVEASTFWAGCGAVRRAAFEAVGGFDAGRYRAPSIEDIELGYRLRAAGHRVLLEPALQVTHLKRWTLASMVRTDVLRRAIPWSRLILERRHAPDDLNLRRDQRISVALTGAAVIALAAALLRPALALAAVAAAGGVVAINHRLFRFFHRQRGPAFALACIPLHLLHYLGSGAGFTVAWIAAHLGARPGGGGRPADPRTRIA